MRKLAIVLAISLIALAFPGVASAVTPPPMNVTACGTEIPAKVIGVLQQDLVCTGGDVDNENVAVLLQDRAQLDLNTINQSVSGNVVATNVAMTAPFSAIDVFKRLKASHLDVTTTSRQTTR